MSLWLSELVPTINEIGDSLLALFIALAGALVLYWFRLRPKLSYGRPHSSRHVLNLSEPDQPDNHLEVYNEQFFVANEGRRAATEVEIVLSNFPRNVAINPPCQWTFNSVENGYCQISIPYIAPQELFTVDCIYLNQRAAFIVSVRCADSVGKPVNFWTIKRYPDWVNTLVLLLIVFGVAFLLQFIVEIIRAS